MKRKITLMLAVILTAWVVSGCKPSAVTSQDVSVVVGESAKSCSVRIIEIDGYKFAVAVGYRACSIVQIRD